MAKLSSEEQEILRSVDAGEWRSVPDKDKQLEHYREVARATLRKDRRINIRISSHDLEALQKRAIREGMPYQTLIGSVLHKFAAGRLKEA